MRGEKPGMADAGEGVRDGPDSTQRCRGKDGQRDKTRDRRAAESPAGWLTSHRAVLRERIHCISGPILPDPAACGHAAPEMKTSDPEES